ncbi:lymphotoxin-beta-like [Pristis pectinata]|uniref:lymphotoxin-beta-like n=1 Tax=Pristis pectinata TaxID=685728 RepID=UPI00223DB306|nr:lymphotoxin-beta-like [Pristis pectinata]
MGRSEKAAEGDIGLGPVFFTVLLTLAFSIPITTLLVMYFKAGSQLAVNHQVPHNSSGWAKPSGRVGVDGEPWGVGNTSKPAAHLIGIYQDTAEGEGHRTLMWEPVRGLAFTRDSVRYQGHSLIVPQPGLYYIYCQVGFRGTECKETPLTLSHQVYRWHDSYPQPLLLLTGTETVCGRSHSQGVWYTTLSQGAMVELEQDHHLYVNVSDPNLVDYLDGKTFFGVIKI